MIQAREKFSNAHVAQWLGMFWLDFGRCSHATWWNVSCFAFKFWVKERKKIRREFNGFRGLFYWNSALRSQPRLRQIWSYRAIEGESAKAKLRNPNVEVTATVSSTSRNNPDLFELTFKPSEMFGSAYCAIDDGHKIVARHSDTLSLRKGLTFELYRFKSTERYTINYSFVCTEYLMEAYTVSPMVKILFNVEDLQNYYALSNGKQ